MTISGIIELLKTGDKTITELASALDLSFSTVESQLVRMCFRGQAHIFGFASAKGSRKGGRRAMLWRLGPGTTMPRVKLASVDIGNTAQEDATVAAASPEPFKGLMP